MESRSIILTEFPAPCNMKCEYCYVRKTDKRRKAPFKKVTVEDFKKLAEVVPNEHICFHFCSIGEPINYPWAFNIFTGLMEEYPVVVNSNLLANKWDKMLECPDSNNLAIWFSIHWKELMRLDKVLVVFQRARRFLNKGITVWPMMVLHPSYYEHIDHILWMAMVFNLKIKMMHYRDLKLSPYEDGLVFPPKDIMYKLENSEYISWEHWNESYKRWGVKGRQCSSGVDFLVVDSNWKIRSCGGKGNIEFGVFPDDLETIQLHRKGKCESEICPCSWAIFHGICEYPRTISKVIHSNQGKLSRFYGR